MLSRAAERNVPQSALQTLSWVLRGLMLERLRSGSRSAVDLDLLVDFLVAGLERQAGTDERATGRSDAAGSIA